MTMPEVVDFIDELRRRDRRRRCRRAPRSPRSAPTDGGYLVVTDQRDVDVPMRRAGQRRRATCPAASPRCADGGCRAPSTSSRRWPTGNPDQLADGGVLVVGASATGVQLADEIHRVRPPGDARGRRARAHAPDLPGPRHPALDGRHRPPRRALRPGRGDPPGPRGRITAARRDPRTDHVGPERAHGHRGDPGGAARDDPRRGRACSRVGSGTTAPWPTRSCGDCSTRSTRGSAPRASTRRRTRPSGSPRRWSRPMRRSPSTSRAARSAPSSGPPGSSPTSRGSSCPCSTIEGASATTAVSSTLPASTCLGATFLRRRKSSFIHGAADDAADLSDHLVAHLAARP